MLIRNNCGRQSIRGYGVRKEFDGVIDFDQALRDPAQPKRMNPAFDSGDHLHPNEVGYKAMADAIDLSNIR